MINRENYSAVQRYLNYLEQVRENESNTIKRRRIQLRHLLEWADEKPFCDAPKILPTFPRYLTQHRNDKQHEPLAQGTVVRTLGVAREFFVWLRSSAPHKYRVITDTWLATLKAAKSKRAKVPSRDVFILDDVLSIANLTVDTLTDWRDQAAIAFLFLSGMRVGALVTLTLECVDMASRTVKQWPTLGVRTKNSKAATTYLLDIPELLAVVKRWDEFVRKNLPADALWYASVNNDGTVLTGATLAGLERRAMVAKGIKRLCSRAGVAYHSPHKLRHGFTVYALKKARDIADLKAVSQNLMHSSLTITDSIYGILSGGDVAERITALSRVESGNGDLIWQLETLLAQLKNQ